MGLGLRRSTLNVLSILTFECRSPQSCGVARATNWQPKWFIAFAAITLACGVLVLLTGIDPGLWPWAIIAISAANVIIGVVWFRRSNRHVQ